MMQKNILFIHHVSYLGGAERYLIFLVEHLKPEFKPYFITQDKGDLSKALVALDAHVEFMPLRGWRKLKYWVANLFTVHNLVSFGRRHKIQLICANGYRTAAYAVRAAQRLKIPSVVIVHDDAGKLKLENFYVFKADHVIGVSIDAAKKMSQYAGREFIHVYNGIDLEPQLDNPKAFLNAELKIPANKKVIGMVGNIVERKGHKLFFDAIKHIEARYPDIVCVIIGNSPDDTQKYALEVQQYAKNLKLDSPVFFTGRREDALKLLTGFDILVLASDKEPFGRVLIEAMSLGVVPVATKSGGPEEIIEDKHSGLLFDVGSREQLEKHLIFLLSNNQAYQDYSRNGRQRVNQLFTAENTIMKFNDIFRAAIGSKE